MSGEQPGQCAGHGSAKFSRAIWTRFLWSFGWEKFIREGLWLKLKLKMFGFCYLSSSESLILRDSFSSRFWRRVAHYFFSTFTGKTKKSNWNLSLKLSTRISSTIPTAKITSKQVKIPERRRNTWWGKVFPKIHRRKLKRKKSATIANSPPEKELFLTVRKSWDTTPVATDRICIVSCQAWCRG